MSDAPAGPASAGALLRAARERQGLHIAALAAAIKVHQRKLEALEADRWSELPDATFVRALAQTVCRTLKIDARPVLDLLPPGGAWELQRSAGTLNTPFRERPGRDDPGLTRFAVRPMVLAGGALVVAAGVLYLLPAGTFTRGGSARTAAAESAASAASAAASAAGSMLLDSSLAASAAEASAAPAFPPSGPDANSAVILGPSPPGSSPGPAAMSTVAVAAGVLQVSTTDASWVEVRDVKGQVLLSRTVLPAEPLGLDVEVPVRLTIGNAAATRLTLRGQPVDLKPSTRDNVARLDVR
jgi:cytoskeleton protein RodZ